MPSATPQPAATHAQLLTQELDWAAQVIDRAITRHFAAEAAGPAGPAGPSAREIPPPDIAGSASPYAELVRQHKFGFDERLLMILAMAPELRPESLDLFLVRNANLDRRFTEFGGVERGGAFIPTVQTAAFLLADGSIEARLTLEATLAPDAPLCREGILTLVAGEVGSPGRLLTIGRAFVPRLLRGESATKVTRSEGVTLLTTPLEWDDLVLEPTVMEGVQQIHDWMAHGEQLLTEWGLARRVQPGHRVLFCGPPGTGKTLTAAFLGKSSGTDVYRVDLSAVVSKYIGETESNLATIFDEAAHKRWILLFDETDALFGKRTAESTASARYADAEVSYLLSRIEQHPGVVILATNLRANMDDAFLRRFHSVLYFPVPDASMRTRLWDNILGDTARRAADVDVAQLANSAELTGADIVNAVRGAALSAIRDGRQQMTKADLMQAIGRERTRIGASSAP